MTDSLKHTLKFSFIKTQGTFYSAPSILAVFRNVVREMWFEKSGSRKVVLQTWIFFSGSRIVVDQKENTCLQKHFSRITFLHFSRRVVAD